MYFVDKDKLTQKITYLQKLTEDYNDNKRNLYAFERIGQMLIESSVDIGNMIIDGFILRDPGNYKDVIDILELKMLFQKKHNHISIELLMLENSLHHYIDLNMNKIEPLFDALPYYKQFIQVGQF